MTRAMSSDDQQALLYLSLGMVAGTLTNPDVMARLIESLKSRELNADYVRAVYDRLHEALDAVKML